MSPVERLVVDASAVVALLVGDGTGIRVAEAVAGRRMCAPGHLEAEVLHALKRLERSGAIASGGASLAASALERAAIESFPLRPLVQGSWTRRHRLSAYDAAYVALASELGCPVLTCDRRWQRSGELGVSLLTVA